MIFEFNSESIFEEVKKIENQFMVGSGIMVCGGDEVVESILCFFPAGKWFSISETTASPMMVKGKVVQKIWIL